MKLHQLRRIIREEVQTVLTEVDIQPAGIQDETVIANLNRAVRMVSASIRPKLKDLLEDPTAAKDLTTIDQRAAVITAIAMAFGISEQDFSTIISKVKSNLKSANVEV